MSASSAALNDEATSANVSPPSVTPGTSSYANIVQKVNNGDKDKEKANGKMVHDTNAKKSTNTTANNNNNQTTSKMDKAKESSAQAQVAASVTVDSSHSSASTNENADDVIDPEDDASFTPVVSHSRKDRNSRRNKVNEHSVNGLFSDLC